MLLWKCVVRQTVLSKAIRLCLECIGIG
ncbi:MAG: CD1871A family CXXC motif-containing protein [Eubacterium sp.]